MFDCWLFVIGFFHLLSFFRVCVSVGEGVHLSYSTTELAVEIQKACFYRCLVVVFCCCLFLVFVNMPLGTPVVNPTPNRNASHFKLGFLRLDKHPLKRNVYVNQRV